VASKHLAHEALYAVAHDRVPHASRNGNAETRARRGRSPLWVNEHEEAVANELSAVALDLDERAALAHARGPRMPERAHGTELLLGDGDGEALAALATTTL